jgi:Domain of unknown function (DUF4157)/Putative Ig domain
MTPVHSLTSRGQEAPERSVTVPDRPRNARAPSSPIETRQSGVGAPPTPPSRGHDFGLIAVSAPRARQSAEDEAGGSDLGAGSPLDPGVRTRMEAAFGESFSSVRVHTDGTAQRASRARGARAFAVGEHLAFASGEYQPATPLGESLIAHELAHVSQYHLGGPAGAPSHPESALEADAGRSTVGAIARLWPRMRGAISDVGENAKARLATGLSVQRCTRPAPVVTDAGPPPITAERVEFTGSHAMTAHAPDPKWNPVWTPVSADHAAAYTRGANPVVNARFRVGSALTAALPDAGVSSVSVRVKEGGVVRATQGGIVAAPTVDVTALPLTGLGGSTAVGAHDYTLQWEGSADGATWIPLVPTGPHTIYWVNATPTPAPLYNLAVSKATRYATGRADVPAAIRSGPRRVDGLGYDPADSINTDPLTVYADGVGICTDYANLLTVLALSVGFAANPVLFWGGFESLGKYVWATFGGGYLNLVNVRPTDPAFNPPVLEPFSPHGWAFNYHAISHIEGAYEDAALDRRNIDAEAFHAGKAVRFMEFGPTTLPAATKGTAYSQAIARRDQTVRVTVHDVPHLLTNADFNPVVPLPIPPAAPSPFEAPVLWNLTLASGPLPPGLSLSMATGEISGTPTAAGNFHVEVEIAPAGTPGFVNRSPVSLRVNP